ncbi:MAG: nucleotidyl transferase AbiEii/AbiGii toxin family protein [Candidatus Thiodiazotropha lotti]|nr:nucleotidyl transferase AbiEii/AbiGii toxin family protein [Candidatus Thiodiazotropha lotti]MCG8001904.1 nucleotidyl transferase AbiEii/AbiGii toxin family protein [Candidatus Thiodiazotropha lotti]MCG8009660.1 nucleotidyl transferase AbiEii/AbiGii toxin family protein [Candidatus Thiodiazotropha lotti]MCW4185522.1 nucleotidyl transferase AbiEii/AbiGii toxin family protein [Candidatus Thiodiazotropha lotti]MCW4197253.1 nucleotidyl transferase AbiEii/AbiGii toxin family protein [Candidatus T
MIELIQQRLDRYKIVNPVEEEQAIKEILQEIALYSLWQAGFFEVAAFQGGTSLRILHGLPRFSEDLDFILKTPDPDFEWNTYLERLMSGLEVFGLRSEAVNKSRMDQRVKKALLKDNSIGNQLNLAFYRGNEHQKLKIKLEIDINPPEGSGFDYTYLDFPLDFEVCHQDLSSNFSLKIHALLCRPYVKGRDWYDFNWYVKQNIQPNYTHLQAALNQYGPWEGQNQKIDKTWLNHALLEKVAAIDWTEAAEDVARFISTAEQQSLQLWSKRFFGSKIERLG